MRWNVEVKPDVFEDVGADWLKIEGGALVFMQADGVVLVAYGQGAWITVSKSE